MELKEGYMSLRDLSLWFGLKPDTFKNSRSETKEKRFKIL